jgi:tRNA-binding protein
MSKETKPIVSMEESIDRLEIRIGRIIAIEIAEDAPKRSYKIKADFGKFGVRTSVGRFTMHSIEELKGKQILGILNLPLRKIGETVSEFFWCGVQYPRAESGEATVITPLVEAKIGSKLF